MNAQTPCGGIPFTVSGGEPSSTKGIFSRDTVCLCVDLSSGTTAYTYGVCAM